MKESFYPSPEPALVQAARSGDLQAFNRLIDRYQDLLFRIAWNMLGDQDSAEDAAQTAWISAFRKIDQFRGGCLRTWLVRVVVNTCYDEIRKRHRRREVPLLMLESEADEADAARWLADPAPGIEERLEADELERTLQQCLQSLTPVYRTMLVLVDIEGLTYEQAAIAAHVPAGTVRSRLARARMALRQSLRERPDALPAAYLQDTPAANPVRMRYP